MLHLRVVLEEHPVVVNIVEVLPDARCRGLALSVGLAGFVATPPHRQQDGKSSVKHGLSSLFCNKRSEGRQVESNEHRFTIRIN